MLYRGKCPAKIIHVAYQVQLQDLVTALHAPAGWEAVQQLLCAIHLSIGNFSPGPRLLCEFTVAQFAGAAPPVKGRECNS